MRIKKIFQSFKPKIKHLLGVDLSSNSIRLVELSGFGSGYQVEACINIALDTSASDDVVIEALKKTFEQKLIKTKNVAVALPHAAIVFKEIKIASGLTDKEIENFLQFNMEKYVGETAENISFDYQIIEMPIKNGGQMALQLVVARREHVEKLIKPLWAVNLSPRVVDVDSSALERAVRRQLKDIVGLVAIINIDNESILIVVIDRKKIIHTQKSPLREEEMQTLDQIMTRLKLKMQPVAVALRQPLEKIVLAGEKALFPGLLEVINVQFNVPAMVADPFEGMKLSAAISQEEAQKIAPAMLISCGLALRLTDVNWN
ncbi:MAG: type IV pilus biogenesis protein PilM [uncultured bacterium]|nr:MAG: type IV pilus biogenesis protein PilM [uncultured bacterium]